MILQILEMRNSPDLINSKTSILQATSVIKTCFEINLMTVPKSDLLSTLIFIDVFFKKI